MYAATAWDDAHARAWTVMGRLRERQARQDGEADFVPFLLAFLFALPDSDAMRMLDARGGYFDVRTGDTWDLFFPGYFLSTEEPKHELGARLIRRGHDDEQRIARRSYEDDGLIGLAYEDDRVIRPECGDEQRIARRRYKDDRSAGREYTAHWYFRPEDFDDLRKHVEQSSKQRWQYSGGTDLVLVTGWLPKHGDPTIDWASTISGQLTDQSVSRRSLTLANVIENISRDLENET